MPEVDIIFEQVEYPPPAGIGQFYIQGDGDGIVFVSEIEYFTEVGCYNRLELFIMSLIQHDLGKIDIVFDDQHYFVCGKNIIPVISNFINDLTKHIQVVTHFNSRYRLQADVVSIADAFG